ncbi:glycerophosphodiester phosphodiesterase [Streptomyces sp. ISL-112]|uniref:glycerophosphodiester phosphodiesterase n=1 Tax=unclassified Streptomyces TaxID=2593676 RepID=UPI001BE57D80|nr:MULTISPECIES: glycerophosphodiester phosphodiesterase [unclassified Streptomyces]MBT2426129.1 glycerophosphodiester phosphodiesterase [Streptomyces sp. ISL-112]MBT2461332.1 glycerophosphodiester phosphodiesterase [Streptomyces sp. ISL-63]
MSFPEGVPSVPVRYTITSPTGGGPGEGTLQLMPTVPAIRIPGTDGVFTGGGTYQFTDGQLVDGDGEQVRLLPTNVDGANPTVWAWLGIEQINGQQPRHFYFPLDADADEVDLGAVQQLAPDLAQYLAVPGESAYDAWRRAGNEGDEADFLASLVGPPGDITAANDYTDEAVTEGLAAEAARADAAYDPAGAATAAQAAAVDTAAADATTKANTARDGAVTTAAQDATTKAGNAQTAAVTAAATAAANLYLPKALLTVDAFMAQPGTKVFGHRGAGMVCPEHTEVSYDYAISHGIQAMELSVNVDSEGQLWCLHDLTLDRTTYNTGALNTYPSTGIANRVLTNGRVLHGQGWTDQPMVPLRTMLDKYLGRVVLFLEPKGNDAVVPLQTLLTASYPHAPASVIWKAHVGTSFTWPKNNGYRTWCYVDDASSDAVLDGKDSQVDYWGVSTSMSSARRQQIVARGKPVFSWPVYRRSQRAALEADGIVGLMSSDPVYVRGTTAQATASRWDQQVKESGGTPMSDYTEAAALKFAETDGWVSINRSRGTYGLGRYCPIAPGAGGYRIQVDMGFHAIGPNLVVHSGLYFGRASADPYQFGVPGETGGYHLAVRQSGLMRLYRHAPGIAAGRALGAGDVHTAAPKAGEPMTFEIDVTPDTVEVRRLGHPGWTTGPILDDFYRGAHFGLSNGSVDNPAARPFWDYLVVTEL